MRQSVDFPLCTVGAAHLFAHIIFINAPSADQILIDGCNDIGMLSRRDLTIIGERTGIPQKFDPRRRRCKPHNVVVFRQIFKRLLINRW
ncbi:hypothetical protein D9M69_581620 [compost metagenome]